MTAITILAEDAAPGGRRFRAVNGDHRAEGRTIGEALDALLAQWGDAEGGAVEEARVVLSRFGPDAYFFPFEVEHILPRSVARLQMNRFRQVRARQRWARKGFFP